MYLLREYWVERSVLALGNSYQLLVPHPVGGFPGEETGLESQSIQWTSLPEYTQRIETAINLQFTACNQIFLSTL